VLWLAYGAALWFARRRQRLYWVVLLTGAMLLLTQSLFSHASSAQDAVASIAGDWLHLTAVALWVGGLAQFVNIISPVRQRLNTQPLAVLVGHFSNYARVAVAAILASGFYSAWLLVGTVEGLLTTVYGRALLVKLILVVPLLSLGAVNLLVTRRELKAGNAIWGTRLRALVSTELALAVIIMAAVGIMTAIAPARNIIALRVAAQFTLEPTPFYDSYYFEESQIHIDLEISPGWVGENSFKLRIYTHTGDPITDASLIRLRFEALSENLGESELRPEHQGEGVYLARGTNLSLPGEWRIRVTLQRPGQYDTVVDYTPQIEAAPVSTPEIDPTPPLQVRLVWLLLTGVALLVFGGLAASEGGLQQVRSRLLAAPLLIVGTVFVFYGVQAALQMPTEQETIVANSNAATGRQETTLPNPIQPDAASIDAGHALYAQYCVSCHGTEGKGDGPVGMTLNPRPADLTIHTAPGVHTDGQLYEWITNGFPGSAMPAWGGVLSETDRWNLVNYIRTLGQPQ
jgi:copper transport protein